MQIPENTKLKLAYDFLESTNQHVFLTGKAGTGKTTFLKNLKKESPKRMVVVAPTGVAAINAGGVTIHSFFQLPFGPQVPEESGLSGFSEGPSSAANAARINRFSKIKINIIRSLDLLVIDEISMVRADVLDAIDAVLRRFKNRYQPFGGVQLLMIGDLQQLAPVVKEDDWKLLKDYYDTPFFFSSLALKKADFTGIELQHIYRQSDEKFIGLLNKVRDNRIDENGLQLLNSRYKPGFTPADDEGYITLTTHNYQSQRINNARLEKLTTTKKQFHCSVEDDFPELAYPADEVLEVKTGAQVMFLKNDSSGERRYYNGKIGKVVKIHDDEIEVQCPGESEPIVVERDVWENTKYNLNEKTSEIEEDVVGKFIQFPLKLAWAITIHKSQGLTFEKAIIDARQSFAHGQVYVALSRCTSLEGLVLSTPLDSESVVKDETVLGFTRSVEENQPGSAELTTAKKAFELQLLTELFDFNPVVRQAGYMLKIWSENAPFLMGTLRETLQNLMLPVQNEMIDVADKFNKQVEKLLGNGLAEENEQLQERLQKAADYFLAKMKEHIFLPLEDAGFQTDNRKLRKRLADALGRLEMELEIKQACLNEISSGFSVKSYLETRAKASIEKPTTKTKSKAAAVQVSHPDFYKKLTAWRDQKAEELELTESRVLRQKVMVEIAEKLPATVNELKAIKGMGGKKLQQFGEDVLSLIMNYRRENNMEIPPNANEEIALAGLSSNEISLELFKRERSIEKVAKIRQLATSTIESHLAHFVGKGELELNEVIDPQKLEQITRFLKENPTVQNISEIKERLGNEVSYGEIRLVLADWTA